MSSHYSFGFESTMLNTTIDRLMSDTSCVMLSTRLASFFLFFFSSLHFANLCPTLLQLKHFSWNFCLETPPLGPSLDPDLLFFLFLEPCSCSTTFSFTVLVVVLEIHISKCLLSSSIQSLTISCSIAISFVLCIKYLLKSFQAGRSFSIIKVT